MRVEGPHGGPLDPKVGEYLGDDNSQLKNQKNLDMTVFTKKISP
jgi:hypothetical protein